jgi:hypothetical protein
MVRPVEDEKLLQKVDPHFPRCVCVCV